VPRPESVDAFLPIGALVALKNLALNGVMDTTHPAALVLLLAFLGTSFLLRRGICGWVCPAGTLSEAVSMAGERLLGRTLSLPSFLDSTLRLLKYLILLFFLKLVLIDMPAEAAAAFLQSPYYKVVDAKLLDFWLEPGRTTLAFLVVLLVLTLLIRNFWCRYLCPYGALLGILAMLGLAEVRREERTCTGCGRCTHACSAGIEVHTKSRVRTPECMGCMKCITTCRVGALRMSLAGRTLAPATFAALLMLLLFIPVLLAELLGYWHSGVSYAENARYIPLRDLIYH